MACKIKLLPVARFDLQDVKNWYKGINPVLAKRFKEEVNREIDHIGEHPEHYQIKYKGLRQALG